MFSSVILGMLLCTAVFSYPEEMLAQDKRMDTKITLDVKNEKLDDVLKEITKKTGVVLEAGSGERDWRVRERHVTIHAKGVKLGILLAKISGLLQYRITRGGEDQKWDYLYWQDKKAHDLEEALLASEREAAVQAIHKLRQASLDAANDALNMTPDQAMAEKDSNPYMAYLGGTQSGRGFAQLLSYIGANDPLDSGLMLNGQMVTIPISEMPGPIQQAANNAAGGGFSKWITNMSGGAAGNQQPSHLTIFPVTGPNCDMGFGVDMGALGTSGVAFLTGDSFGDGPGMTMGILPLTDPNLPIGQGVGKVFLGADEGKDVTNAINNAGRSLQDPALMAQAMAEDSPTEKNPPKDPELTREIEMDALPADIRKQKDERLGLAASGIDEMKLISKAFDRPVLFESFVGRMPLGLYIHPGKQQLYKVLIGLEKAGYTWAQDDGVFRIRAKDWALRRSYEIPESFMVENKKLLDNNGEFSTDDLAAMAIALSDDQIIHTLSVDPDLGFAAEGLTEPVDYSRSILRFYGGLSAAQKTAVCSDSGMPFSELTSDQWDKVNEEIAENLGGVYVTSGYIRLMPSAVASSASGNQSNLVGKRSRSEFDLVIYTGNDQKPKTVRVHIRLPSKDSIARTRDAHKKALEEAAKAEQSQADANPVK
jgi:hypothetical protein